MQVNPKGRDYGFSRVFRGGVPNKRRARCTTFSRRSVWPSFHGRFLCFRVVWNFHKKL